MLKCSKQFQFKNIQLQSTYMFLVLEVDQNYYIFNILKSKPS